MTGIFSLSKNSVNAVLTELEMCGNVLHPE